MEETNAQIAVAGHAGEQGGQPPQSSMLELADQENMQMMNGQQLPPTEGADMQHTQGHIDFVKTGTFKQATPEAAMIFKAHINGELEMNGKV